MRKTTTLKLLPLALLTACGAVASDPSSDDLGAPDRDTLDFEDVGVEPTLPEPPAPGSPLIIDAPRAATTARSLFLSSVHDHDKVVSLVGGGAEPAVDVLEQRIVTTGAEPVTLELSIAPPSGTFSRVIASDAIQATYPVVERVLCETGSIATFDPKCDRKTPQPASTSMSGAITAARWRLWVMDEATGASVEGCSAIGTQLACTLPGRAVATYRIVASVDSVAQLWGNATTAAGVRALAGKEFTGATEPQYQCWDWEVSGTSLYCRTRYDFTRYTAIDHASIELDPLRVTITAGGVESTHESAALAWDGGDDDLPGAQY
ncbi:MAG TPA: hypothetical protein VM513_14480 [Kofleriaceae bacterium]|jgi:hypothetical protein|nr:hypothetical protein [Kofleriaceae bacterium]